MPNTVVAQRQYPLVGYALAGIANIGAGNGFDFKLPPKAYLTDVFFDTITAFDGTTNTVTASDGTTTFINAQDIKSTGRETVAVPNKYYPSGGTISFTLAQTGAATVGAGVAMVRYIIFDRMNELGPQ